ncbi:MAG: magnesium transporter, partial [Oscillospiraceae bacterium]|nr:magnesium transporter [Oscillospiraceae bacterium]
IQPKDYFRVLFREIRVALLCGIVLAVANFGRMILFSSSGNFTVFFVVSATLLCAIVVSKSIGCTLPILAKMLHLDPALMAGPMITTIVDMITLLIYFWLANVFLMGR